MRFRSFSLLAILGLVGCVTELVPGGEPGTNASRETTPVITTPPSSATPLGAPIKSIPSSAPDAGVDASSEDPAVVVPPPDPDPPLVTPAAPALPAGKLPLRGVHLAGAEFGAPLPGREHWDYEFPTAAEVDYFQAKGMNNFRIGFMWERVQRMAYADFEHPYFDKLDALVRYATGRGAYVVLEPHNFARYYDDVIGSPQCPNAVFADFWRRLATLYRDNPLVIFNLVNEPSQMRTDQWVSAANAAIAAIRQAGASNLIEVPGNQWTGAWTWNVEDDWGMTNAVEMLKIVDPVNNSIYEAHQYLDADAGGGEYTCQSRTVGTQRLQPFLSWLRANGKKGLIGEFAGGRNNTCKLAIADMMNTIDQSSDVLVGWTWWAAGPAWDDYNFSIEPDANGTDAMQMSWLAPYLVR